MRMQQCGKCGGSLLATSKTVSWHRFECVLCGNQVTFPSSGIVGGAEDPSSVVVVATQKQQVGECSPPDAA